MTRLSLTRVARSIGQAAVVAVMVWGRPSAADAPRIPIEVEVQPGAVSCAPGDASFDRGFRAALQLSQLATVDTARKHGVIPNAFCLASDRQNVLPLRVRVRMRCDAGMVTDYVGPTSPDAVHRADHWLVHVAVPLRPTPPREVTSALTRTRPTRARQQSGRPSCEDRPDPTFCFVAY